MFQVLKSMLMVQNRYYNNFLINLTTRCYYSSSFFCFKKRMRICEKIIKMIEFFYNISYNLTILLRN